MFIHLLRFSFVLVMTIIGENIGAVLGIKPNLDLLGVKFGMGNILGFAIAVTIIAVEVKLQQHFRRLTLTVIFGVFLGLLISYFVVSILESVISDTYTVKTLDVLITIMICYVTVILVVETKDEFKFIIPYLEFRSVKKGITSYILDTNVIIDGRICGLLRSGIMEGSIIIPEFIVRELQILADSPDALKRQKGKKGLDSLEELKDKFDVKYNDEMFPQIKETDRKLIQLSKILQAKLLTADENLRKASALEDVDIININSVANALRPRYTQGDRVPLLISQRGETKEQGVGYLDDGTMVVVENGGDRIGTEASVEIRTILQKNTGKIYFARIVA